MNNCWRRRFPCGPFRDKGKQAINSSQNFLLFCVSVTRVCCLEMKGDRWIINWKAFGMKEPWPISCTARHFPGDTEENYIKVSIWIVTVSPEVRSNYRTRVYSLVLRRTTQYVHITVAAFGIFLYFKKIRGGSWDHLAVCVRASPLPFLSHNSKNTFPRQRIHTQQ
jgi:hypothetical protein